MTYEVAFKRLKEKFANVDAAKMEEMAVQVTMTDEDCTGTFYFKAVDGKLDVQPYDYRDNDAVIDTTRDAFAKILDGKLTVEKAVEKGDLTVKGDLAKIDSFQAAVKVPEKKAPAKKEEVKAAASAKKEEVKAAASAKKEEVKAAASAKKEEIKSAVSAKKEEVEKKAETVKKTVEAKQAEVKAEVEKKAAAKKTVAKKAPAKTTAKKTTK